MGSVGFDRGGCLIRYSITTAVALDLPMTDDALVPGWLQAFHAGKREALEGFYRENYAVVDRAVGRVLSGADRETVVHEVFFRVLSTPELRQRLTGGSPAAWIASVARNHAIDYHRRRQREVLDSDGSQPLDATAPDVNDLADARLLLERFCRDVLPTKWRPVFETCFVRQLTQRDAARELGISRTTLLYQQHRVRALLRKFLLEVDP